jgi:hypothetical protein
MSNTDPNKRPGVNPGVREGEVFAASYKTSVVFHYEVFEIHLGRTRHALQLLLSFLLPPSLRFEKNDFYS